MITATICVSFPVIYYEILPLFVQDYAVQNFHLICDGLELFENSGYSPRQKSVTVGNLSEWFELILAVFRREQQHTRRRMLVTPWARPT